MTVIHDTNLMVSEVGPSIDASGIEQSIPESFPWKDGFRAFYITHNGLDLPDSAAFHCDRFRSVPSGDHNRLSVSNFYIIPRSFGEEHDYLANLEARPTGSRQVNLR